MNCPLNFADIQLAALPYTTLVGLGAEVTPTQGSASVTLSLKIERLELKSKAVPQRGDRRRGAYQPAARDADIVSNRPMWLERW